MGNAAGSAIAGTTIKVPPPRFSEEDDASRQRATLEAIAGSKGRADDLLRDSITAPFVFAIRDIPTEDGSVIRAVDLWYVIYADLDALDPESIQGGGDGSDRGGEHAVRGTRA